MNTRFRRSLAATGAAAILGVLGAFGAVTTLQSTSADPADPGGSHPGSPGILSGNVVTTPPVHVPVEVCSDTVDPVGGLNPAVGNTCAAD